MIESAMEEDAPALDHIIHHHGVVGSCASGETKGVFVDRFRYSI